MRKEPHPTPSSGRGKRGAIRLVGGLFLASAIVPTSMIGTSVAAPAPDAPTTTVTTPGDFSVTVPEGVCGVQITLAGGAGGDALGGSTQGGGALIELGEFAVDVGDEIHGVVGGAGGNGGDAGVNGGGEGSPTGGHRGAGGGGYTEVRIESGNRLALAAGGGGSGGGHVPAWGHGGDAGVPTGTGIYPGSDGLDGWDAPNAQPGGGAGAGTAFGGAGGVHPDDATLNGHAGSALQGGAGGDEHSLDGGAGGGGGLFGGGGGASTVNDSVGGAGGGGGSSQVASSSPFVSGGLNPSGDGFVELNWTMCEYDLSVTKKAGAQAYEPGVPVGYTVTVTNEGPQDMAVGDTVTITDALAAGGTFTGATASSGDPVVCNPQVGDTIPAGGIIECWYPAGADDSLKRGLADGEDLTLTYEQTHSGDAPVENTVSVTDRGNPENNTASATVDPADPSLTLEKSASPKRITKAGQKVSYVFEVTNTGNIALEDIAIDEGSFSGTGALSDPICPDKTLEPGDKLTCSVDYTATQADVDAGELTNTATATGATPGGLPAESETAQALVDAVHEPQLELKKSADPRRLPAAGEQVTYTFKVTNTGNVTLNDVEVDEGRFSGTGDLSVVTCPDESLAPGDSLDCTATYEVTKADAKAGKVTNTATASAVSPGGDIVESDPSTVTLKGPGILGAMLPAAGLDSWVTWLGIIGAALVLTGAAVLTRRRTV